MTISTPALSYVATNVQSQERHVQDRAPVAAVASRLFKAVGQARGSGNPGRPPWVPNWGRYSLTVPFGSGQAIGADGLVSGNFRLSSGFLIDRLGLQRLWLTGGVGPTAFYSKAVGAVPIEGSEPGIYRGLLRSNGSES